MPDSVSPIFPLSCGVVVYSFVSISSGFGVVFGGRGGDDDACDLALPTAGLRRARRCDAGGLGVMAGSWPWKQRQEAGGNDALMLVLPCARTL